MKKIAVLTLILPLAALAQILVSANDNKEVLLNGVHVVLANAPPDTATIIDFSSSPPKFLAELNVPASWSGPPQSVAITPDGALALVTNSTKMSPADATKTVADRILTVIDLQAKPPAFLATLQTGLAPNGVSINAAGTLALVANRAESSVSVFTIHGKTVTPAGRIDLADTNCGPSMAAFTPDGKTALVTCTNTHRLAVLSVNGTDVRDTKHDISAGLRPVGIEITPEGEYAIVGNIGNGPTGGVDTLSVVELKGNAPRVVNSVAVGVAPEGIALSPKGDYLAVNLMNGSILPTASPYYRDFGILKVLRRQGADLTPVTEVHIGHWCQGVAWSRDQQMVIVGCMTEKRLYVFHFDGTHLTPQAPILVNGGPAGMGTTPR